MWENWLFTLLPEWAYTTGQKHYERLGDSFMVVAPFSINMTTQCPTAIHEITSRREHFPKATEHYKMLEMYGSNIITTEGPVWRFHRKVTSASFNEKNASHTFAEAIHQSQSLVRKWKATAESASPTIHTIEKDTMSLALYIIGYVGFGMRFTWPGEETPDNVPPRMRKYGNGKPAPGHNMTFADAIEGALHHILLLLLTPTPALKFFAKFSDKFRDALHSWQNYDTYMKELLADKIESVKEDAEKGLLTGENSMDIMGQLVRQRYDDEAAEKKERAEMAKTGAVPTPGSKMTDAEVIGNAFIMLLAGHETTANSLQFAFILLACNPASQRALQLDVDRVLGRDTDPTTWDFESNVNNMMASMIGAAVNETLRLIPPVVNIPKCVSPTSDQSLHMRESGQTHVLPAGCDLILNAVSSHRHPKFWPNEKPEDLDKFMPQRWFLKDAATAAAKSVEKVSKKIDDVDTEDYGGFSGPDTSAQMFRPVRGSFVPFSNGPRSCLGRRIGQVEMLATLAVVFQRYSIELAVDDWASDKEVEAMNDNARQDLYYKAKNRAEDILKTATTVLTLRLRGTASVPIRLVPRGEERFVHCVDVDA